MSFFPDDKTFHTEASAYDLRWDYIEQVGIKARAMLSTGLPVSIDYQPGNGTRYPMVLTPMKMVQHLSQWQVPSGHGEDTDSVVIVTMVEGCGTGYSFEMLDRHGYLAPNYVASKLGYMRGEDGSEADGQALAALFAVIAGDPAVCGMTDEVSV